MIVNWPLVVVLPRDDVPHDVELGDAQQATLDSRARERRVVAVLERHRDQDRAGIPSTMSCVVVWFATTVTGTVNLALLSGSTVVRL